MIASCRDYAQMPTAPEIAAGIFMYENGYAEPGPIDPNMPVLEARRSGRDGPVVALCNPAPIHDVAHTATLLPAGFEPLNQLDTEILSSYALGVTQQDQAKSSDPSRRTLSREAKILFQKMGVTNAPSAVYKGVLHGVIEPQAWQPADEIDELKDHEILDAYLACLGFEKDEAAMLRSLSPGSIKRQRISVLRKLGANTMAQAAAHLFTHPDADIRFVPLG